MVQKGSIFYAFFVQYFECTVFVYTYESSPCQPKPEIVVSTTNSPFESMNTTVPVPVPNGPDQVMTSPICMFDMRIPMWRVKKLRAPTT